MVSAEVRVGRRGDVVLPKVLQKRCMISPGDEIVFYSDVRSIIIRKSKRGLEAAIRL